MSELRNLSLVIEIVDALVNVQLLGPGRSINVYLVPVVLAQGGGKDGTGKVSGAIKNDESIARKVALVILVVLEGHNDKQDAAEAPKFGENVTPNVSFVHSVSDAVGVNNGGAT